MRSHVTLRKAALAFIVVSGSTLAQNLGSLLTAEALLREVVTKYRSAKTYSDSGTSVRGPAESKPYTDSFEIHFARSVSLRFDFVREKYRHPERVVWWSDAYANQIWSSESTRIEKLAANDLYRARWDIGGPAYYVPALLDERYANPYFPKISALPAPAMAADDTIEGVACYHLVPSNGAATPGRSYDLWIGKEDLLIRKFAFRSDGHVNQEVHRNIQIDAELPSEIFRVVPPKK